MNSKDYAIVVAEKFWKKFSRKNQEVSENVDYKEKTEIGNMKVTIRQTPNGSLVLYLHLPNDQKFKTIMDAGWTERKFKSRIKGLYLKLEVAYKEVAK